MLAVERVRRRKPSELIYGYRRLSERRVRDYAYRLLTESLNRTHTLCVRCFSKRTYRTYGSRILYHASSCGQEVMSEAP